MQCKALLRGLGRGRERERAGRGRTSVGRSRTKQGLEELCKGEVFRSKGAGCRRMRVSRQSMIGVGQWAVLSSEGRIWERVFFFYFLDKSLTMHPRLASSSLSCLSFLSAGITGVTTTHGRKSL
jgi:hypothetical protein